MRRNLRGDMDEEKAVRGKVRGESCEKTAVRIRREEKAMRRNL
jgi:hypothetical protein